MRTASTCALVILGTSACLSEDRLTAHLPERIDWVGLVQEGNSSVPRARLVRVSEPPTELPASKSGALVLVGYEANTLSPLVSKAAPEWEPTALLWAASACEPRLPTPDWAARFEDEAEPADWPPASVPPLTSNLFDSGGCEPHEWAIEVVCAGEGLACPVTSTPVGRCVHAFETCPSLGVSGTMTLVDGSKGCLHPSTTSCALLEHTEAPTLSCSGSSHQDCELVFHPIRAPPIGVKTRIELTEHAPREPNVGPHAAYHAHLRTGYVADFELLSSRIVLVARERYAETRFECSESSFLFFNRAGARQDAVAAPYCVRAVAAAQGGRSFIVASGDPSSEGQSVSLHDEEGTLLHQIEVPEVIRPGRTGGATEVVRLDSAGQRFVILFSELAMDQEEDERRSSIHLVDLRDGRLELANFAHHDPDRADGKRQFVAGAVDRAGKLVVLDIGSNKSVLWLSLDTLQIEDERSLILGRPLLSVPAWLHLDSQTETTFVAAIGSDPGLWVLDERRVARSALVYELGGAPAFATAAWDEDSLLATSLRGTTAYALLFDKGARSFQAGLLEIGFGLASRIRNEEGAAWVLLPWEPALVKIGRR